MGDRPVWLCPVCLCLGPGARALLHQRRASRGGAGLGATASWRLDPSHAQRERSPIEASSVPLACRRRLASFRWGQRIFREVSIRGPGDAVRARRVLAGRREVGHTGRRLRRVHASDQLRVDPGGDHGSSRYDADGVLDRLVRGTRSGRLRPPRLLRSLWSRFTYRWLSPRSARDL